MQAMELLYNRQFEVEKAIILATDKTSSYSRAFNEIARQAIHIGGKEGLSIARQLGSSRIDRLKVMINVLHQMK